MFISISGRVSVIWGVRCVAGVLLGVGFLARLFGIFFVLLGLIICSNKGLVVIRPNSLSGIGKFFGFFFGNNGEFRNNASLFVSGICNNVSKLIGSCLFEI